MKQYDKNQTGIFTPTVKLALVALFMLLLAACAATGPSDEAVQYSEMDDELGVLLTFSEREEAGTPLFKSRMFVNNKYLYINDDRFPEDFLLFDRAKQTIYSVTHANKTVFVIRPKEIAGKPPIEINYVGESQPSSAIPKVSGRTATHYRYMANGDHCYDAVTLEKDFMPGVVAAMKEFRSVLAGEHASTVHQMPSDTHEACDLAVNIYYATRHLDTGLPLREWDRKGYLRFMIDYKVGQKMEPEKLQIPADYKEFSIDS